MNDINSKTGDCCGTHSDPKEGGPVSNCCHSTFSEPGEAGRNSCGCDAGFGQAMRKACLSRCKWPPFVLALLGGGLFALTYYLDSSTVQVLWMSISGLIVLAGLSGFLGMSLMVLKIKRANRQNLAPRS